jgi:hypothetical protein
MKYPLILIFLTSLMAPTAASERPAPASFTLDRAALTPQSEIEQIRFDALDLEAIAAQDALRESGGGLLRFAYPHAVDLPASRFGRWDEVDDLSIWRFRIHAENATLTNLGFRDVRLPADAQLFVYSPKAASDRQGDTFSVIGPYGSDINQPHGVFWTPNLVGEDAIIEVSLPTAQRDQFSLTLHQVSHGYRGFGRMAQGYQQPAIDGDGNAKGSCDTLGGNRSGSCNQDVACLSDGDLWNEPRRSVGAYQVNGIDFCTGSLVNNTNNDQRMLFMTARHCIGPSDAANVVIFWNYEWPTCRRPGASGGTDVNPPDPNQSSSGTSFIAATRDPFSGTSCPGGTGDECSDMILVEVNDTPDEAWNLHWAGWDRRPPPSICADGPGGDPTNGLCATIHHPGVDEKRITWVNTDIEIGSIAGSDNVHWHPFWHSSPPELPNMPPAPPATIPPAVTEGGSSGSPLYSAERRLIGVLSGGPAACGATGASLSDFYGGLFHGWEGLDPNDDTTRMRPHLDPAGTNPEFIDGTDGVGFSLTANPTDISQCGFADLAIQIESTSTGGFTDPITLSTVDLPATVSGVFGTNPLTPGVSTSLTLSNLAAQGVSSFSFDVEGVSGAILRTLPVSVNLADANPGVASLTAPSNGDTGVGTSPTLEWTPVDTAVSYEVEIATDPAFNNVVYASAETATQHTVEAALNPTTLHYVRIRAVNDCGVGPWSTTVSFTTANLICSAPGLAIPDGSASGVSTDIVVGEGGALDSMEIQLDISHSYVGDLIIALEHVESGTSIDIMNRVIGDSATFGCNANNVQTTASDAAPLTFEDDCNRGTSNQAYPEPAYRPDQPLSTFAGTPLAGTWRLFVSDNAGFDTGTINEWCLRPVSAEDPLIFDDRFEDKPL